LEAAGQECNIRLSLELCRIHVAHILSIIDINITTTMLGKTTAFAYSLEMGGYFFPLS
jgi:hypothetical protein